MRYFNWRCASYQSYKFTYCLFTQEARPWCLPLHKTHWSQQRDAELASSASVSAQMTAKSVSGRKKEKKIKTPKFTFVGFKEKQTLRFIAS